MDLNKLNEVTDQISSDSQAYAAIETSVARAINELRYNGHAVVDLPKGISFNEFKSIAAEYINENWGNSIFSGKLDLQFSPLGDKVSIRNKGGIASTSDSIVTDGVDPRKYINKIKQEGHEVVNGNGLYELAFEDDILQGVSDINFSNLDEFIDIVVQGGKSRYGLYVIELPDCNFYSLEEFVRHKNYMNDVEEEDITDTITEPDNLDDWIYECTSKGDFYGDTYFQCIYHGHDIELKYDENKWNFFIDGELIHDWDHLDEIDDSNEDYDYVEYVDDETGEMVKVARKHKSSEELEADRQKQEKQQRTDKLLIDRKTRVLNQIGSLEDVKSNMHAELKVINSQLKDLYTDMEDEIGGVSSDKERDELGNKYGEEIDKLEAEKKALMDNIKTISSKIESLDSIYQSIDDCSQDGSSDYKLSDAYKDGKHGCYIYTLKKDGTRPVKPNFIQYIGSEKTPEDVVKRLEKNNPGTKFVPAGFKGASIPRSGVSDDAQGEVSFANVTNDTIFVLCNGHISKRFNSVENANKWINSTFNPSQFTLAKRENGVLTEI